MGYSTTFTGELRFTKELTGTQLAALKKMLGADCRDHPDWSAALLMHIDLELTDDFGGLKWNGSEKTYDLPEKINIIIAEMRKTMPDFGLTGQLAAQGEEALDRWALVIGDDGFANEHKLVVTGKKVTCPHCEEDFVLEDQDKSL